MFDHSQINFNVATEPLFHDNKEYTPDFGDRMERLSKDIGVVLKRTDTNEPLAVVSEAYAPVQYDPLVSKVEEALTISGLDMTDAEFETNVFDNGAKLELRAKFPAHSLYLDSEDKVIPEFCFRTSHNRTWANNGMMGLWRSKCWNTLVSGDKLAYVYGRHTKNFNVSAFAAKIKNAGAFIAGDGFNQMKKWYTTEVHRDAAANLFTHTLAKRTDNITRRTVANKVMLSNLMKIFDEENRHIHGRSLYEGYATRSKGTLWTAYQAATHWSSHNQQSSSNSKRGRPAHTIIGLREDKVRKMLQSPQWMALAA
jgi:PII-like signaling protein